ncbi:MAG: hypothetical protein ACTIJ2_06070 [Sphingobacteriaceae bacterium]
MDISKRIITAGLILFFLTALTSCNSGTEGEESDSSMPADNGLSERYNINAPDEELMNVDSAETDSSVEDSVQDTAQ